MLFSSVPFLFYFLPAALLIYGFARWMQDQFSLRDAAVNTQRAADEVLFRKAEEGGILRSSAQVRPGDRIELRLAQGSLGCRVEEVEGEETHGKENL